MTWPALETYIEIEGPSEKEIHEIAIELGMDWEKRDFVSTDVLYSRKYNMSVDEILRHISNITFENIPEVFQ